MWRRASSEPYRYRASERALQIPSHVCWVYYTGFSETIQRDWTLRISARLGVESLQNTADYLRLVLLYTHTYATVSCRRRYSSIYFFSANDYIIRGTEIYSGYRYSEISWDILRYLIDIPVATAIASRGVLGTSMTLPARNIKNPGPGMPASIVLYLLPCKCRTKL